MVKPRKAAATKAAQCPGEVTHAFTLRGAQLTYAVLNGHKRVENRHFALKPGWYALHTGAKTSSHKSQESLLRSVPDMAPELSLPHSAVVGAVCVSHALRIEQCASEPWAFGPFVNVLSAFCRLETPVLHAGALSVWSLSSEAISAVRMQLAHATIIENDTCHLQPPSYDYSGEVSGGGGTSSSGGEGREARGVRRRRRRRCSSRW